MVENRGDWSPKQVLVVDEPKSVRGRVEVGRCWDEQVSSPRDPERKPTAAASTSRGWTKLRKA